MHISHFGTHNWQPYPSLSFSRPGAGFQGGLVDHNLGGFNRWRSHGLFGRSGLSNSNRGGYVLDFNRNGRYNKGQDGVLAFDMNRDGRIDRRDVNNSKRLMDAATGNFDFNRDGRVSRFERIKGRIYSRRFARMDRNRDGVLNAHEINRGGGKVWIDSSRGGGVGRNELHSVFNLPNSRGYGPSQRLDFVDPFSRSSHTSNNFYDGGWGCCCGGGGSYVPGRMYSGMPGY
jgi:hypothetical protein